MLPRHLLRQCGLNRRWREPCHPRNRAGRGRRSNSLKLRVDNPPDQFLPTFIFGTTTCPLASATSSEATSTNAQRPMRTTAIDHVFARLHPTSDHRRHVVRWAWATRRGRAAHFERYNMQRTQQKPTMATLCHNTPADVEIRASQLATTCDRVRHDTEEINHRRRLATSIVRPLPSCQHGYPRCSKPQEQRNVDRLTTSTPMCHSGCMRPDHMQICG
ncbi:hypothetical protein K466DRAFT_404230 [Polyporus arcularius HHB13444]|uniref:Uncharacterized protein n=1 Tax=Polyporus arcularius HHB13444 TaxID=1314778 RepID=A0A5C3PVH9_9APHY|nr:hypothetical protein K466DRAFT_404230 [Polyporus arcularius HHB13444]